MAVLMNDAIESEDHVSLERSGREPSVAGLVVPLLLLVSTRHEDTHCGLPTCLEQCQQVSQ